MKKTKKTITSLELPDESKYRLTKKKAVNPNSFFISEGDSVVGELTSNPIKLGERCSVVQSFSTAIHTSAVKEIKVKKNSSLITLVTENSVYELEEV